MLDDAITLDQLRVFVTVAQEGSFSAASRALHRAQSAVSYAIANLEEGLGVELFDRTPRRPELTAEGAALLGQARVILEKTRELVVRARAFAAGAQTRLSVAIDELFPIDLLTSLLHAFRDEHPHVDLMLITEALGGVIQRVQQRDCDVGITSGIGPSMLETRAHEFGIVARRLLSVPMFPVAASSHPAAHIDDLAFHDLREHTQIVLTDRSPLTKGVDLGVLGSRTWRVAQLAVKKELLISGFGWGNMPEPSVRDALTNGALVRLKIDGWIEEVGLPFYAIHRDDTAPGPAATWMIRALERSETKA
ncbi:MAG: LysR family transcriptional regulator [Myxococcota bacterium]